MVVIKVIKVIKIVWTGIRIDTEINRTASPKPNLFMVSSLGIQQSIQFKDNSVGNSTFFQLEFQPHLYLTSYIKINSKEIIALSGMANTINFKKKIKRKIFVILG